MTTVAFFFSWVIFLRKLCMPQPLCKIWGAHSDEDLSCGYHHNPKHHELNHYTMRQTIILNELFIISDISVLDLPKYTKNFKHILTLLISPWWLCQVPFHSVGLVMSLIPVWQPHTEMKIMRHVASGYNLQESNVWSEPGESLNPFTLKSFLMLLLYG